MGQQARDGSSARVAVVYLGGVRAVRSFGRIGSAMCVCTGAIVLWKALKNEPVDLVPFVTMYACGAILAGAVRLWALRWVAVIRGEWTLVPIVGRAMPVPRLTYVYESGEDVVAVSAEGHTIVLGVDRFPNRDPVAIRRQLVADLCPTKTAGHTFPDSLSHHG